MPLGPTVRRRRLGAELRRLREAHSLKLEEVAEKLGLAPSTLSRIETGKAPTKSAYLTAMLEMYEVEDPGARKVLVDMAREGHRKGWWSIYDDVLPSGFDIYVGLEAEASGLRSYESDVVHGLLQTTDYALTVLRELRPRDTEEQIRRVVDLRMQRQRLLDQEPPLEAWIILDEGAIRRSIGGAAIMRHQLEQLIKASRWPNVTLQVLGFECGAHAGRIGSVDVNLVGLSVQREVHSLFGVSPVNIIGQLYYHRFCHICIMADPGPLGELQERRGKTLASRPLILSLGKK